MRGVAGPAGLAPGRAGPACRGRSGAVENPEFKQLAAQQALPLRFLAPDAYRTELFAIRTRLQALGTAKPWRE
ncbi:hypothetical protein [Sabulicella rubraurantiaca]|uniref:hypothetical protein n=1 Tax=Sabulicella rubraurantiaca TaxID=2811429 RepID=UPI001A9780DD|nr:hypothetical protein [Sabulicella rubraurantiaca]